MPALLMQCSKIADELKMFDPASGPSFRIVCRNLSLCRRASGLMQVPKRVSAVQRPSVFTVTVVRSVPQPDLQTVGTQPTLACF